MFEPFASRADCDRAPSWANRRFAPAPGL